MTTVKCLSAKATSSAVACDGYDVTTKILSQTMSRDGDHSHGHGHDHDYTNLTQVSSTNTIHSDLTIMPNTNTNNTNMEDRPSNTDNMQPQSQGSRPRTKGSQKSRSRASSTSQRAHTRSTSSSTAGNSTGRRPGPPRRTTSQIVQQQMSPQKREQLIALHRESCRLFQDPIDRPDTKSMASPTASPTLQSQRSHSFPLGYDHDISDEDLLPSSPNRHQPKLPRSQPSDSITPIAQTSSNQVMIPATITEWTSPSTRRREYEKIDRNNKGFRRLWRRWTPSCMHSGDERVPFWEEEISKKKNYEGSVRRFRMDIPDEVDHQIEKEKGAHASTMGMVAGPKVEKGTWSCF